MAKIGEGDSRWVVKDRSDGANCNNWHWTTKDASRNMKDALVAAVKGVAFPPDGPLAHVRIKSVESSGEASVNNRKGRTFLIYELSLKCKWTGELRDETGSSLESCHGSLNFPDISAESLDDLDAEFTTSARGTKLSEAFRKQGSLRVRETVVACIQELQKECAESATIKEGVPRVTPAVNVPLPQPIAVGPAPAPGSGATLPNAYAKKGAKAREPVHIGDQSDSDEDAPKRGDDDDEAPPPAMVAELKKLRADPKGTKRLRLSNLGLGDHHLRPLCEALQDKDMGLEELDLTFNKITDAGIHLLTKALHGGAALELTKLHLGGNRTSPSGMALSQHIKQARNDILVDWKNQLPRGKSLCTVGTVYPNSPAQKAGLQVRRGHNST